LKFRWVVLQGGENSVRIKPLGAAGRRAELTFLWQPPGTVPGHPNLATSRVDVGVFASDGRTTSLPAFVCSFTLASETREYDERGRVRFVEYRRPDDGAPYVDPVLDVPKSWRDEYRYADDGLLTGWTRIRADAPSEEFTADGRIILSRAAEGRPESTRAVRYEAVSRVDGTRELRQVIVE
jgi:hypothetical protein